MGGICWLTSYPKSGNTGFRSILQNSIEDGAVQRLPGRALL